MATVLFGRLRYPRRVPAAGRITWERGEQQEGPLQAIGVLETRFPRHAPDIADQRRDGLS